MPSLLFISDLHLSASNPDTLHLFLKFLQMDASKAEALYILGDLFDSWVGDDVDSDFTNRVRQGLKALASQTRVHFQPGNRDFLIGTLFAEQTDIRLLEDETVIEINGQRILLMHGDLLCTDDKDYQQARKTLRSPAFIDDFLAKPVPERTALAAQYRKQSGEAIALKAADIMDVNQQAVLSTMRKHHARLLIHGHTHRPHDHVFEANGQQYQRLVLADWSDKSSEVLQIDYSDDNPGLGVSRYQMWSP